MMDRMSEVADVMGTLTKNDTMLGGVHELFQIDPLSACEGVNAGR